MEFIDSTSPRRRPCLPTSVAASVAASLAWSSTSSAAGSDDIIDTAAAATLEDDEEDDEGPRLDGYKFVHLGLQAVLPSGHRCLVDPDTDEVICVQSYDAEGPWTAEECESMHMAFRPRDSQQIVEVGLKGVISHLYAMYGQAPVIKTAVSWLQLCFQRRRLT